MNKHEIKSDKGKNSMTDEEEIISLNPKSIKTILIYLIYFPLMGF